MIMTINQRKQLRTDIGDAWMHIQNKYKDDYEPTELLPEMVSGFVGIAWFIAKEQFHLDKAGFLEACMDIVDTEETTVQ